jgi:three-Cys-motif partner protein
MGPHTEGKHRVLRNYLGAWFGIMGTTNGKILFVDGFAGPGEYVGGEQGSPIIALDALLSHSHRSKLTSEIVFFFLEPVRDRFDHLQRLLEPYRERLPSGCKVLTRCATFDQTLTEAMDYLAAGGKPLAPAFIMIDPFGVSDTPMAVIRRVLANPKCELYVSLMYESINRFCTITEFEPHLDALFGTPDWRSCGRLGDPDARRNAFYELYENQLRDAGARHVVHFDLCDGGRLVYSIFFATKNSLGCDRMKQAIWKVAPWGDSRFVGSRNPQTELGLVAPDFRPLVDALVAEFRGKGPVRIERIEEFVMSDRTEYHSGQLRSGALKPLENSGRIVAGGRKRAGTYPDGTVVTFL